MAHGKDVPRIQNPPTGDGHHITYRYLNSTELAKREARQKSHDEMMARQQAYEERLTRRSPNKEFVPPHGCVFAKSCNLSEGVFNHNNPSGFVPVEKLTDFGSFCLLGGRESNSAGEMALRTIGGSPLPVEMGALAVGGVATTGASASAAGTAGAVSGGVIAGALLGIVAMLWPSSIGDSALYTEEQLKALERGRTRVRLHVEQKPDGSLKGYAFHTQSRSDWEWVPVVQFVKQDSRQVAEFGNGVSLIWTPSTSPSRSSGVPPLEGAPRTPHIWVYPTTQQADNIIVDPIYPPEYKDFILVFPAGSGIKPLYIVLSLTFDAASYHGKTDTPVKSKGPANGQTTLDNSVQVKSTSPRRIGVDEATDEFVVFDRTGGDVYHGHVRSWDQLHQDMKNALIKTGKTDTKGKILGASK